MSHLRRRHLKKPHNNSIQATSKAIGSVESNRQANRQANLLTITELDTMSAELMFDKAINDEMLCQIFLFLSVEDLLTVPQVCSRWKNTDSEDVLLWGPHLRSFWADISVNRPSEIVLRDRVKCLPLNSLLRALCRVDISRCVEKPDFHNMLIARLIFGDRSPEKRQSRFFYPEWSLHLGILTDGM